MPPLRTLTAFCYTLGESMFGGELGYDRGTMRSSPASPALPVQPASPASPAIPPIILALNAEPVFLQRLLKHP